MQQNSQAELLREQTRREAVEKLLAQKQLEVERLLGERKLLLLDYERATIELERTRLRFAMSNGSLSRMQEEARLVEVDMADLLARLQRFQNQAALGIENEVISHKLEEAELVKAENLRLQGQLEQRDAQASEQVFSQEQHIDALNRTIREKESRARTAEVQLKDRIRLLERELSHQKGLLFSHVLEKESLSHDLAQLRTQLAEEQDRGREVRALLSEKLQANRVLEQQRSNLSIERERVQLEHEELGRMRKEVGEEAEKLRALRASITEGAALGSEDTVERTTVVDQGREMLETLCSLLSKISLEVNLSILNIFAQSDSAALTRKSNSLVLFTARLKDLAAGRAGVLGVLLESYRVLHDLRKKLGWQQEAFGERGRDEANSRIEYGIVEALERKRQDKLEKNRHVLLLFRLLTIRYRQVHPLQSAHARRLDEDLDRLLSHKTVTALEKALGSL